MLLKMQRKQDVGMISNMMQESSWVEIQLMLMANMVEHNPEMIVEVYNDLSEQNFDLFYHIETAEMTEGNFQMYEEPTADDPVTMPAVQLPMTLGMPNIDPMNSSYI